MPTLIGKPAPHFSAKAIVDNKIVNDFSLEDFKGKNVLFFFYPLDFTFVCPTELHAFQEALPAFEKRNTQVIGCSVDSCYAHMAWLSIPQNKGGIQGVSYPLVADITKNIARDYGVLHEAEGIAYRGLFLLDKNGVIRHIVINDLPLGRSVVEALRMVDALDQFEEHGEVCPANWQRGERTLQATASGIEQYFRQE
jgi:peroxiredoxin (alkyl hydroperoxide reductase subunit C)